MSKEANCDICCMRFTNVRRLKIECPYCKFCSCNSCFYTYNDNPNKETNCMNCKQYMFKEQYSAYLSKDKQKKLINHMKKFIFTNQMNILTDTKLRYKFNLKKEYFDKLIKLQTGELKLQMILILQEKKDNLSIDNFKICVHCNQVSYKDQDSIYFECDRCNLSTCSKCEQLVEEKDLDSHDCDGKILESLEIIKKETKPCPTCGTKIFKADGCSQVMCSECNTFFDFKTGLKEKDNEPKHARGFIEMFDKFEKKVIGTDLYDKFVKERLVERAYIIWKDDTALPVFSEGSCVRTLLALVINAKTSVLNAFEKYYNMNILNYQCRVNFINKIYSKETFIKNSYSYYIITKRVEYACIILTKMHFRINVVINRELKKYFNSKRTKTNAENASKTIFKECIIIMNELFNHTPDGVEIVKNTQFEAWLQNLYLNTPDGLRLSIYKLRNSSNLFKDLVR